MISYRSARADARARYVIALACLCALLPGLPVMAQATRPAGEDPLRTLRRGHPRLMVLDEDIARVRGWMADDPQLRELRDTLRARAERTLDNRPVEHRLEGPRLLRQSRTCLYRVSTLAGMYRLEGDRRFAARAEQEMLTAAAFPDWNPKHFLDTAEMTNALAIGYDWLYDVLPQSSRDAVRTAIIEKGLRPGLAVYQKENWWAVARHNWNQVCNGGMLAGALAVADEEPALARQVIQHAARSIPLAMATLAPDGGWPEGPGYWSYAMRYTAFFLAAAETALNTDFGLNASPGFAETGLFRIHGIGPTGLVFNFADGGPGFTNAPEMLYFARIFDRSLYAVHQRTIRRTPEILDLLWHDPRGTPADIAAVPTSARFRGIDVVFLRSAWNDPNALFVGFKGGDNAANHSNLDLGTFVLDALGERWAIELGPDDYNLPGYFGAKRWTYYRLRTEGQNTLMLSGENQKPRARAPIVAFDSSPQRSFAIADLSAAYDQPEGRIRRGVMMLDGRQVLVQDELELSAPTDLTWTMHTNAQVHLSADGNAARLEMNGKVLSVRALAPGDAAFTVAPVQPEPPQRPLENTRKLLLRLQTKPHTRLAVLFTPAGDAPDPPVRPLRAWTR